jgi:hypothetical protein
MQFYKRKFFDGPGSVQLQMLNGGAAEFFPARFRILYGTAEFK